MSDLVERLKYAVILLICFVIFWFCRPEWVRFGPDTVTPNVPLPAATPGLELQKEDYARVRSEFQTKLVKKGPAPQAWEPPHLSTRVTQVEYPSGGLHLTAYLNRPGDKETQLPAVLYLHGGWAFADEDWDQAKPFRDAGYITMMPLLRGENGQPGTFTMFLEEIDDVLAAADYLATLPFVDAKQIYVAGHSAGGTHTLLTAMASDRFRAAASFSGSPDRIDFVKHGWMKSVPFDQSDVREFQVRSPVAYARSFKCPVRIYYGSRETVFRNSSIRTALLAKQNGLDVEALCVPGDHYSSVPEAMRQAIEFFQQR
jgi:dipeptidyl aminopeptidase/acylaminoacyl peptidase